MFYQQFGGKHRSESQCGKRGNDNRTGYHDTEFTEKSSSHTVHKYDGEEYGYQCDGGRDYGKENFLGTLDTGFFGWHPAFNTDINVFCHYNGIIHHQTYCQHYRQHGKYIDGESCQIHYEECSDKRNGNHDTGYQCYTPVAQEEEDNDNNENECYIYRFLYLTDRSTDKLGIVETIRVLHVIRKVFLHLFHAFINGIGNLDVIGTWLRYYNNTYHRYTIHFHVTLDVRRS